MSILLSPIIYAVVVMEQGYSSYMHYISCVWKAVEGGELNLRGRE